MAVLELRPRRRFTVQEVLRMVETGILSDDEPVELLDGELVLMTPQDSWHATTTKKVERLLEQALGPGFHARAHSPIAAATVPETDLELPVADLFPAALSREGARGFVTCPMRTQARSLVHGAHRASS